jgi:hypothetical protein
MHCRLRWCWLTPWAPCLADDSFTSSCCPASMVAERLPSWLSWLAICLNACIQQPWIRYQVTACGLVLVSPHAVGTNNDPTAVVHTRVSGLPAVKPTRPHQHVNYTLVHHAVQSAPGRLQERGRAPWRCGAAPASSTRSAVGVPQSWIRPYAESTAWVALLYLRSAICKCASNA